MLTFFFLSCTGANGIPTESHAAIPLTPEQLNQQCENCYYFSFMPTASWTTCPTIAQGEERMPFMHPDVARDYPSCRGFYTWPDMAPPADNEEASWRLYCAATILSIENAQNEQR